MQRIGVFVCWCGSNIAATVDVEAVAEGPAPRSPASSSAANYPVHVLPGGPGPDPRTPSGSTSLAGVVICSCSPRMHEADLPQSRRPAAGPQPLSRGDRQHPGAVLLDPQGQGRRHGEGHPPGPGRRRQGPPQRPPRGRERAPSPSAPWSSAAASPASRPPSTSPTPASRWTSWKSSPPSAARWPSSTRPSPPWTAPPASSPPRWWTCAQDERIHIYAYSEVETVPRLCGQLPPSPSGKRPAIVDEDHVHRLRPVHREVPPEEGAQRVQPGHGQPPGHLHPLRPGRAQGGHHRPRLLHHAQDRQVRRLRQGLHRRGHRLQADRRARRAGVRRHRGGHGLQPHQAGQVRRVCLRPESRRGHLPGV